MRIKQHLIKVFIYFSGTVIATIFGWQSSKALSVERKAITEQTIEERLTNVRKRLRQEVIKTFREAESNTSPCDNQELAKCDLEIEKNILAWGDWLNWSDWPNWNNWANWPNWGNYWSNWGNF